MQHVKDKATHLKELSEELGLALNKISVLKVNLSLRRVIQSGRPTSCRAYEGQVENICKALLSLIHYKKQEWICELIKLPLLSRLARSVLFK